MKVGVVIPFYQREPGILPRALASIQDQHLPPDVQLEVIVVDDQSPVPVSAEMAIFRNNEQICWSHVSQANGGPGAARNTGIDWMGSKGIRYLAFLDSDDEWCSDHLSNAISALERGGDFYFADHARVGLFESHFNEDLCVRAALDRIIGAGLMQDEGGARIFAPGEISQTMLENYLAQTSTVVLRLEALGEMRFDPELRHAGEDYMMWIELALSGARICISNKIEVVCGTGLNMYYGARDWDSEDILTMLTSEIIFHRKLVGLPLGAARKKVRDRFQEFRRLYAYLLLRRLAQRRLPRRTGLSRVMRRDPLLAIEAPLLIARFLLHDRPRIARQEALSEMQ